MESIQDFKKCVDLIGTTDDIATDLKITVMTVGFSVGSPLNLQYLFDKFNEKKSKKSDDWIFSNFVLKYKPEAKKTSKKEIITSCGGRSKKKERGHFFNSLFVEFPYKESKKIHVKIFKTGYIGIQGNKTIEMAHEVPQLIVKFIKKFKGSIEDPNNFKVQNLKINMINSGFSFKSPIRQKRLKDLINEYKYNGKNGYWRIATFQPGKYAGVNAKFWSMEARDSLRKKIIDGENIPKDKISGQVSVFIFRSGNVNITGAKNTKELFEAYRAITTLVRIHRDEVMVED